MNWIDIALLLILTVSVIIGLWRGLVYEVLSVAAWVVAFFVAQAFAEPVGQWLPMGSATPTMRFAAGFALVFIAAAFAGGWVAWLVKKMVETVGLRPIDRVLGGAFGLARGVIILFGVAIIINMTPLAAENDWQQSVGTRLLGGALHSLKPLLPEVLAGQLP